MPTKDMDRSHSRRKFMRKIGGAGTALGVAGVAGCLGEDDPGTDVDAEEGLAEERMVRQELEWVINTERYYPERFQTIRYLAEQVREDFGVDVHEEPVEITVHSERGQQGDFDLLTHNWTSGNGDPDSILVDRFHADGAENDSRFDHEEYNELAMAQRRELDDDERQELVFECQRILGEQRPEQQQIYNEDIKAYNADRIDPDSIVIDPLHNGFSSVWNWTSMEPLNEEGERLVTNNWDPSDQLNPFHHNARGPSRNNNPTSFLHDFLVRPDPETFDPEPWAAESIEYTDDTTCVVTLRDDMLFHDGEPVTVDDVIWSFEKVIETDAPAYSVFVEPIESVEATGDWEITFTLDEPHAPFDLGTLGEVPIMPQHYWEELIDETGYDDEPWEIVIDDDRPVVGSGPFQWGMWDQGERFEMPAFDDHPFAAPNIEMRVQRPLATRDAELEALVQGDYDILDFWFGDPIRLQERVEEEDHLVEVTHGDDGRQRTSQHVERPPFDDVAFRQALNALIRGNTQVIIEEIYSGFGEPAISPINPNLEFWHDPDTPAFGPGTDAAIEILEDAGYAWDPDGNLHHPEDRMDQVESARDAHDL